MAEYISRDLALSFPFGRGEYDRKNANPHFIFGCETYKEWLEGLPTADVAEVRHGHWYGIYYEAFACSACGAGFFVDDSCPSDFNYCPNCGAKMDESEGKDGT